MSNLLIPLTIGFLGSLHCIGMCGPIALALPVGRLSKGGKAGGILLYNLGRVFTYALLGAAFGALGRGLAIAGLQQVISLLLGAAIIASVLMPANLKMKMEMLLQKVPFLKLVTKAIQDLFRKKSFGSFFFIGALNGLLPCGFVYLGIAGAIASGTTISGSLFMALFGLGTIPAMFAVAFSRHMVSAHFRVKLRRALPVLMLLMGAMLLMRGMNLGIAGLSPRFNGQGQITRSCCQRHHQSL